MKGALLDTNAVSDLLRHPAGRVSRAVQAYAAPVFTSVVVAAELRFGAAKKGSDRLTRQVDLVLANMDVLALAPPVDEIYGRLRAELEAAGTPLDGNDLLIAAHALALDCLLVTDDQAFDRVPMLAVENWLRG